MGTAHLPHWPIYIYAFACGSVQAKDALAKWDPNVKVVIAPEARSAFEKLGMEFEPVETRSSDAAVSVPIELVLDTDSILVFRLPNKNTVTIRRDKVWGMLDVNAVPDGKER